MFKTNKKQFSQLVHIWTKHGYFDVKCESLMNEPDEKALYLYNENDMLIGYFTKVQSFYVEEIG